jgi:hypothetical protein
MIRATIVLLLVCLGTTARALPPEVDVELFLAVDVSRSMAPAELAIQRRGYASALRSPEVGRAIGDGLIGAIAVTYVEWSGTGSYRVVIPWTLIDSPEAAETLAKKIETHTLPSLWRTSITSAIDLAATSIAGNDFEGLRRVIDVSGDGPNNQGGLVTTARDRAVAQGITINGLPLMTREGLWRNMHLEDLDLYYQFCVIGGPGAFVIPVLDWDEFAVAVRNKLVLEIAGLTPTPRIIPAQYFGATEDGGYDCTIGERIWRENRRTFDQP